MSKPTRFRYWENPLYVAKLRKPITFYSSKRFFFGESPPLARYPFNCLMVNYFVERRRITVIMSIWASLLGNEKK